MHETACIVNSGIPGRSQTCASRLRKTKLCSLSYGDVGSGGTVRVRTPSLSAPAGFRDQMRPAGADRSKLADGEGIEPSLPCGRPTLSRRAVCHSRTHPFQDDERLELESVVRRKVMQALYAAQQISVNP